MNAAQEKETPVEQRCMCELCVPNLDLVQPPSENQDDGGDGEPERIPLQVWAARAVSPILRTAKSS